MRKDDKGEGEEGLDKKERTKKEKKKDWFKKRKGKGGGWWEGETEIKAKGCEIEGESEGKRWEAQEGRGAGRREEGGRKSILNKEIKRNRN